MNTMRQSKQAVTAIILAALVLPASACTHRSGSKAGGDPPPVTLRIGTDDEPGRPAANAIEEFARQVHKRSHGQLRIEPVWQAAGDNPSNFDQAVAGLVENGRLDMGMIPSRAWDTENVTSLRALQAPYLVTSDDLLKRIVTLNVATEMLAGLDRAGVTGLALVPESTRHVFTFNGPRLSPVDFRGKTVRAPHSRMTEALFGAMGATSGDLNGGDRLARGVAAGQVVGEETSFDRAEGLPWATTTIGNLTVFAKANAVVVNSRRLAALDGASRGILQGAATATRDWGVQSMPDTVKLAEQYCRDGGTIVSATPAQTAAFRRAAQPVYDELNKDALSTHLVNEISDLAAVAHPAPPIKTCDPKAVAVPERSAAQTFPDGVYRKQVSEQAMLAGGVNGRDAKNHAGLWTMTFDRGKLSIQQRGWALGHGVYCVSAGLVTVAQYRSRCDERTGVVLFTGGWHLTGDQLRFTPVSTDIDAPVGVLTTMLFGDQPWTKLR
jgi:TRAP-type C4-dicarboxylate transport system substrate-binding protein